jgi:type II secretory pathway pseudopilin PulG
MTRINRENGFGLIEVLVAMVMALIVFGATLTILVVYMRQSTAATQRFDAQDKARLAVDRIVRQLRNVASPVTTPKLLERATPYDIVFQTIGSPSGQNTSGTERVRYCIPQDTATGSSAQEVLISQTQTWNTPAPPPDPWSSDPNTAIACPDTTFAQQPNGIIVAPSIVNRYQQRPDRLAFTFNGGQFAPSDLTQISTIQVNTWVNPTPTLSGATTQIQTSAYLRNKQHSPVPQFTYTLSAPGAVVLNGGISYSPDGAQLSFSWACTSASCPSGTSLNSASGGLVTWAPGAGTYTVTLTVTDQNGLSQSTSQQITVT